MTILIVGAHAMDAEIMSGAFALKAARDGHRVVLFHLSRGERGHPTTPPARFGRQLEVEMAEAATALGVEQQWSGLRAPLPHPDEVATVVAAKVDSLRPALVVTHWKGSWHPSHRRSHDATVAALELTGAGIPLVYAENCEDLNGFRVDLFVPIDEEYESWLAALRCYELFRRSEPESKDPSAIPYWAYYTAAARVRGLQANLDLAAAFMQGFGPAPPSGMGFQQCPQTG